MRLLISTFVVATALTASPALGAEYLLANYDGTNEMSTAGGVTLTTGPSTKSPAFAGNVATVTANSGFTAALFVNIPRSGPLFDAVREGQFRYDYVVPNTPPPSPNAGTTFITNHLVANTDVNGFGFQGLLNSGQFVGNDQTFDWVGNYNYDLSANATFQGLLTNWAAGQGTFFQVFMVQQSGGANSSTVLYDNIRLVPEPAALAFLALGMVPLFRRRRARP